MIGTKGLLQSLMKKATDQGSNGNILQMGLGMLTPMMDQFSEKYNKPEEEGGLLKKGDWKCCIAIIETSMHRENGEVINVYMPHVLVLAFDQVAGMRVSAKYTLNELTKKEATNGSDEEE